MPQTTKRPPKKPSHEAEQLTSSQRHYRRHRQEILASKRRRRAEDPVYRAKVLARDRRAALKKRCETIYGISLADYERMYAQQGGRCRICKRKPKRGLCVDHSHVRRKVRRLLCHNCNCMIGFSGDNIVRLLAGAAYLHAFGYKGRSSSRSRLGLHDPPTSLLSILRNGPLARSSTMRTQSPALEGHRHRRIAAHRSARLTTAISSSTLRR
jgi:hypothetical protein